MSIFDAKQMAVSHFFGAAQGDARFYGAVKESSQGAVNGVGVITNDELALLFRRRPRNVEAIVQDLADTAGCKVQGIVTGEFVAAPPTLNALVRRGYSRPAPCGASIGHYKITAGTLGCLVRHNSGRDFILSNNHVLANSNYANYGDQIYQPGPADGGTSGTIIGNLTAWETLATGTNYVDAAIAQPSAASSVDSSILDIGHLRGIAQATLQSRVRKSGRTSGLTEGYVTFLGAYVQVSYGSLGTLYFDDQIGIESANPPFSQPGDSGSVIIDDSDKVVGLLFAGSHTFTLANPIQTVFKRLDLIGVVG